MCAAATTARTDKNWQPYFVPNAENGNEFMAPYRLHHHEDEDGELDSVLERLGGLTLVTEPLEETLAGLRIVDRIGEGGFGYAYKCRYKGRKYVCKLPSKLVDAKILVVEASSKRVTIKRKLTGGDCTMIKDSQKEFQTEFKNAELILDPPSLKQDNSDLAAGHAEAHITIEYMNALKRESRSMKMHPGYAHLHKVLHYIPGIPCIFSEACTGNLVGLMDRHPALFKINRASYVYSSLPDIWLDVAYQMGQAMLFLQGRCGLSHDDIKHDNIFYKQLDATSYHFYLGDYGMCSKYRKNIPCTNMHGTKWYIPIPTHWSNPVHSAMQRSIFAYAASLLSIIKFPHKWLLGNIHTKDFYYAYFSYTSQNRPKHMEQLFGTDSSISIFENMDTKNIDDTSCLFKYVIDITKPTVPSSSVESVFDELQQRLQDIEDERRECKSAAAAAAKEQAGMFISHAGITTAAGTGRKRRTRGLDGGWHSDW